MKQVVKLFIHDLTASRPRVHVDDDINRYLRELPDGWYIQSINYNVRKDSNSITREEALVIFAKEDKNDESVQV